MANQIKAPINYPIIAGGKIVSGGTVLFGQPNVKPDEDNPATLKAVYLDAALTQQAENPQGISSDGVFDQADTGILYGSDNTVYSIVIRGANKKELSYIPEYDLSDANAAAAAQESASQAAASESNAIAAKNLTEALYEDFTNRYFGAYSAAPAVDDLGNPPNEGSVYFNTTSDVFYTWDGSSWMNYFPSNPNGLMVTATGTTTPRSLADWMALNVQTSDTDIEILIPSDFTTLQEAVDTTSGKIKMAQGKIIDLIIESGHQLTHGLVVRDGDYSHYRISSQDAQVELAVGFVGVTVETTQPNSCIVGSNAMMPKLNCLINANDRCNAGYYAAENSSGYVNVDCGVIYALTFGVYATGSKMFAPRSNFSYSNRGNRITANSIAHLEGANLSNSRGVGISTSDTFGLDVSRGSVVYFMTQSGYTADCSNSAGRGLSVRRSWVAASGVNADNAALDGIRAELGSHIVVSSGTANSCGVNGVSSYTGSTVSAPNLVANGCVESGFFANSLGTIEASNSSANNCSVGYEADKGSRINASDGTANECGYGVQSNNGSHVNFQSGSIDNSTIRGIQCNQMGTANVGGATIINSTNEDLRISRGSTINATDCTTTNGAGSPSTSDANVAAFNAISGGNGIIWG